MKPFGLAIIVLLALMSGARAEGHACDKMAVFKHTAATGPVELVPAVPNQRVYYCGFTITAKGPTLDLVLTTGTGTNCATNTVPLTPQMEFPNDFALSSRQESVGPYAEPGQAMCLQTIGVGTLGGMIYFAQF
jgi:hypothetical protein